MFHYFVTFWKFHAIIITSHHTEKTKAGLQRPVFLKNRIKVLLYITLNNLDYYSAFPMLYNHKVHPD